MKGHIFLKVEFQVISVGMGEIEKSPLEHCGNNCFREEPQMDAEINQ